MRTCPLAVCLLSLIAFMPPAPAGTQYGKSPNFGTLPEATASSSLSSLSRHRFGTSVTGGFGVDAELLSQAFTRNVAGEVVGFDGGELNDEPAWGGEFFYEYLLSDPNERTNAWGLRAGLGYSNIQFGQRESVETNRRGFETVSLKQELDLDLLYLNLGPFYERRITDDFYAQFSTGLTAAYVGAEFATTDSTGGLSDSSSDSEFLIGAYASAALGYDFTRDWSVLAGVRYQYLDGFSVSNRGGEVDVRFDQSYFVFLGLRWSF